jgi:hypothetical protein
MNLAFTVKSGLSTNIAEGGKLGNFCPGREEESDRCGVEAAGVTMDD